MVWQRIGLTRTVRGTLRLAGGRLRFVTDEARVFDVPIGAVTEVTFPWVQFGGGMHLRADGLPYRFAFVRPTQELGRVGDIADGLASGRAWRAALLPHSA